MTKEIIYNGDTEVYFPAFKKIVKKGDTLNELPMKEAEARGDFIVREKGSKPEKLKKEEE